MRASRVLLIAMIAGCTAPGPHPDPDDPHTSGNGQACKITETGGDGVTADVSSWPEACLVPFDGSTRAFVLDGFGFGNVTFNAGVLAVFDHSECTYCAPGGQPSTTVAGGEKCVHQYNCGVDGRCPVRLFIDSETERWSFTFDGWGCTLPPGTYDLFPTGQGTCHGVCGTRECGSDGCGNSCGSCGGSQTCDSGRCSSGSGQSPSCNGCLDACSGLPSCCTGCNCLCEDECQGCF